MNIETIQDINCNLRLALASLKSISSQKSLDIPDNKKEEVRTLASLVSELCDEALKVYDIVY